MRVQELDDYFRNVRQAVDTAPEDVLIQQERPYLALQEARNNQIRRCRIEV
ncbi:hypothetical protein [[Leptolyngbya] sp. PCC 7376]|uniref:hypothetical protein n=1 Tax=[Leptolyngbya] sp. PCC 7376 TaxID=111781 RepID=UPI000301CBF8|nr:hypothetical protein [[Leptolyngbya] sp. PCC 7376]